MKLSAISADTAKLRERALGEGKMFVTRPDGTAEVRDAPTGQHRHSAGTRGKRCRRRAKTRHRKRMPKSRPSCPGPGMKGADVDPYVTTAKRDRPMLPEQRAELAALSRDRFLNFDYQPTLTRGEAERLIPKLRKLAKTRHRAQLHKQRQQRKPR